MTLFGRSSRRNFIEIKGIRAVGKSLRWIGMRNKDLVWRATCAFRIGCGGVGVHRTTSFTHVSASTIETKISLIVPDNGSSSPSSFPFLFEALSQRSE